VAGVGQPQCVATGRPNRSPATVNLFRFRDPRYSRIVRQIREASAHYQVSTASLVPTFLRLGLVDRFSPLEILRYGLLSPSLSGPGRQEYRSKETSLELLRRLNPPSHACLVVDKTLSYKYCLGLGLPVPKFFAVLERKGALIPEGRPPSISKEWETFLRTEVGEQFVTSLPWAFTHAVSRSTLASAIVTRTETAINTRHKSSMPRLRRSATTIAFSFKSAFENTQNGDV
jgi:hypothetical protein